MPVFFVFDKYNLDVKNFCDSMIEKFALKKESEKIKELLIIQDVQYNHHIEEISKTFKKEIEEQKNLKKIFVSEIKNFKIPQTSTNNCNDCSCETEKRENKEESKIEEKEEKKIFGRKIISILKCEKEEETNPNLKDCQIIFLGRRDSALLQNLVLEFNRNEIYFYEEENLESPPLSLLSGEEKKSLVKRYFLIEKIKNSSTIGILVLTLSLKESLPMIQNVKNLIKSSGKKYYMFVIGKLNIHKLLNFSQIDCFVIISCPFNSIKDPKKYMKPLATPFELQVALGFLFSILFLKIKKFQSELVNGMEITR